MKGRRGKTPSKPKRRQNYIAAVRYLDGSKDLFYVKNANDLDDAREMVYQDQMNVKLVLLALSSEQPPETEDEDSKT